MELIFLDTETTGVDITKDRLVQVCYKHKDKTYTEYFKAPVPMTVKSMSITHITEKMLEGKQSFADSQMKKDLESLLTENILVAHNAKFDVEMLRLEGVNVPKYICTLRVARHLDKDGVIPEYNLQFLRYYLNLEVEGNPHDAEGDVNVLCAVFERLLNKVMKEIPERNQAIEEMVRISSTPSLYKTFNFGKHKDKSIKEVASTDKGYLEWLLNQKLSAGEEDEDWIFTLKHYLGK